MTKNTFYEWDTEYTDEYGDVVDHDFHGETFPGIPADPNASLVLVRSKYRPGSGDLIDRGWAYVKNGELPANFDDGYPVPERFHKHFK